MSEDEVEFLGAVTRRRTRPGPSRGKLSDRLLAISREEMKECREDKWEDQGVQSDSEPTEVEIINQERLPTRAQVENHRFQEPIRKWVAVKPSDKVPSWNRDLLPEEEEEEADFDPPPHVRFDVSLVRYKRLLDKENIPTNTNNQVLSRQMVLRGNFAEDEEVVVQEGDCIYRTTCGAIRRASREQEEEEDEEEITVVESEDRRRRGGPRQRSRSVSSSPGRDISDWTSQPRAARDHQDHRLGREREESRYSRHDRNPHGGRSQRSSSDERRHYRHGRTGRDRRPLEDDFRVRESHRRSMEDRYYSRSDREERERGERGSFQQDRRTPPRVDRHSGSSSSRASTPRNFQEYNRERRVEREKRRQ